MTEDIPRKDRRAPTAASIALATTEIMVGGTILYWAYARGVYDESSLGTVYFLWGSLLALVCLVVPGIILLIGNRYRWTLQVLPGCLLVLVLVVLSLGIAATHLP